jgi:hypothetical protein
MSLDQLSAQEHLGLGLFDLVPSNIWWQLMSYLDAKARGCLAATSRAVRDLVESYGRNRGPVCVLCGTFAHPLLDSIRLDMGTNYPPLCYETSAMLRRTERQEHSVTKLERKRHCSTCFTWPWPRPRSTLSVTRLLAVRVHAHCVSALRKPTVNDAFIVSEEGDLFIPDDVLEPVRAEIAAATVNRATSKYDKQEKDGISPVQMYNSIGLWLEQQDIDPEQDAPLDTKSVCMILRNIGRLSYVLEFVSGNKWFEDEPTLVWSDKLVHLDEASVKRK